MKCVLLMVCLIVLLVPVVRAQEDHVEAGVFADYFRMSQTDNNYLGIGARTVYRVFPHVKLEAEIAYDLEREIWRTYNQNRRLDCSSEGEHPYFAWIVRTED
jgi:hypothetical protein